MTYWDRENFETLFAVCTGIGAAGVVTFLVIALGPEKSLGVVTVAALVGAYWAHKKLAADAEKTKQALQEAQQQALKSPVR